MTRYNSSRLLTPPKKEEEVYPYRRVWPSLLLEIGGVFGVAVAFFVLSGFLGVQVPSLLRLPVNVLIALSPVIFWTIFSRWRERRVPEPRRGLLTVFIITFLAANAIGVPFVQALDPETWLSVAGTIDRIIGYGVTVGVTHEIVKYLVLRYTVPAERLRVRLDAIAYGVAAALGYASVLNLRLVLFEDLAVDVLALQVFANTTVQIIASCVVAYGIAEARFNARSFLLLPVMFLLAALVEGGVIAFRAGLVNGGFVLGFGGTRPLFGLVFSLVSTVGMLFVMAFLFNNAERRAREAVESSEA